MDDNITLDWYFTLPNKFNLISRVIVRVDAIILIIFVVTFLGPTFRQVMPWYNCLYWPTRARVTYSPTYILQRLLLPAFVASRLLVAVTKTTHLQLFVFAVRDAVDLRITGAVAAASVVIDQRTTGLQQLIRFVAEWQIINSADDPKCVTLCDPINLSKTRFDQRVACC